MRFMPIEGVCYAGLEDISKLGKKVLAEHFPTGEDVSQTTVRTASSAGHCSFTVSMNGRCSFCAHLKLVCFAVWCVV